MRASDPTFPLFPVFAFLAFVLSIIPLSWHMQAWNSGTCAFMIWVGAFCLVEFINSLIWSDNAINSVPVWCDISSQIIAGAGVGIPASILCISRRLYRIISTQTVSITRDDKRRAIYEDLSIAFDIIVQPHRFDIFEEYGCSPATYNTIPAYFLFYMWPILIGLVSFVFSSLTLRSFYMRRIQFNQILSSNNAINPSRYLRLMLLALIDIMCTIPLGIYIIYIDLKGIPLAPWISWADTHFDFGRVILVPAVIWRSNPVDNAAIQVNRWLPIICAFVFFMIFGFAEEAMKNYRRTFWFLARPLGFRPSSEGGPTNAKGKHNTFAGPN
ncbi:pheromone receptor [Lentinula detonsa]|uniref:Pheromone receptor n=1 Tax=Lentinula detonsa TaxID=2804962 RepID=A0AA38PXF0_9AGAR|nr:pheromone receptor [Lentinula detonsa]